MPDTGPRKRNCALDRQLSRAHQLTNGHDILVVDVPDLPIVRYGREALYVRAWQSGRMRARKLDDTDVCVVRFSEIYSRRLADEETIRQST